MRLFNYRYVRHRADNTRRLTAVEALDESADDEQLGRVGVDAQPLHHGADERRDVAQQDGALPAHAIGEEARAEGADHAAREEDGVGGGPQQDDGDLLGLLVLALRVDVRVELLDQLSKSEGKSCCDCRYTTC